MAVRDDFYIPKQETHEHRLPGSDAMLKHILTELGPEFFSDSMKQNPEEKAADDRRKFEELKCH